MTRKSVSLLRTSEQFRCHSTRGPPPGSNISSKRRGISSANSPPFPRKSLRRAANVSTQSSLILNCGDCCFTHRRDRRRYSFVGGGRAEHAPESGDRKCCPETTSRRTGFSL